MSQAWETAVYLSDNSAFSTNPLVIGVRDIDLIGNRTMMTHNALRQSRVEYECRTRITADTMVGGFNLYFTDDEIIYLLERLLGDNKNTLSNATPAATVIKSTLPEFYLHVDKGDIQTYRYDNLRMARMVISGAETQLLNARVDLVGSTENAVSDVTVGSNYIDCDGSYAFHDVTFTIGGTTYPLKSFSLVMDNQIVPQFENSVTQSIFEPGTLRVTMSVLCAYRSDTSALYRRAVAGDAGTLVLNDGTTTLTFTFANVKIPGNGPTVPESGELTMPLELLIQGTDNGSGTLVDSVVVTKS